MEGIVDLLGSFCFKCKKKVIVVLNVYLGVFVGQENWEQNSMNIEEMFINIMFIMFIGFFVSCWFGKWCIVINEFIL